VRISGIPAVMMVLLVSSGCGRDAPPPDAAPAATGAGAQGYMDEEYQPPQLTPAESAAAVGRQTADAEAITRRVMGPDYRESPEPEADTPEKQLANCLAQAASVEEPTRSTILKACERFRTTQ
jgi:hypothetical protein